MENGNALTQQLFNSPAPFTIWFTGLSGSGKSTLAVLLQQEFQRNGMLAYILDGDKLRAGLNSDLDFSIAGRRENVRRTVEVCKLMMDAGMVVITALISPMEQERARAKEMIGADRFFLTHINCPLEVCESRDPKNLYKKVREGQLKNFTGIDSPYEVPQNADLIIDTHLETPKQSMGNLLTAINKKALTLMQDGVLKY